jgi:hypothetical protein
LWVVSLFLLPPYFFYPCTNKKKAYYVKFLIEIRKRLFRNCSKGLGFVNFLKKDENDVEFFVVFLAFNWFL